MHVETPLWVHGFEGPSWLFPPRASEKPAIAISNIDGPLILSQVDVRNVPFLLLDALWLHSTANAIVGLPIVDGNTRLCSEAPLPWAVYEMWRDHNLPKAIKIVTGYAPGTIDAGIELLVRSVDDPMGRTLKGSVTALQTALVDAVATRREAPVRLRGLPPIQSSAYAEVCDRLFRMICAHPNIAMLPPVTAAGQRASVELAYELSNAAPSSEIARLAWLASAAYAHRAGGLARAQRKIALQALRAIPADADDPLCRLRPGILLNLGEIDDAHAEARSALAALGISDKSDPYRAHHADHRYRDWLGRVLARND